MTNEGSGLDLGNAPEYQIWELQGVLVREEHKLPWTPLKEMPGFEDVDVDGVDGKYFGKERLGPFAYMVRMAPGALMPARRHHATAMRFVMSGSWSGGAVAAPAGWFEYAPPTGTLRAMTAGPDGCLCMEIYQSNPRFELPAVTSGS